MTDHFTPFAAPDYATRRAELRLETQKTVAEFVIGRTRLGLFMLLFASLCLGLSFALVLKRAPEITRAEQWERPA